jgi:hypothetical protein
MRGPVQLIVISLIVIGIGVSWLLNVMKMLPGVNWIWTAGLGGAGLLILGLGGSNKLTWVVGPFLLTAAVLSILRQQGRLNIEYEIPILITALGLFMLLVSLSRLPQAGAKR